MALDFGVTNKEFLAAIDEFKKIKVPQSHWDEVGKLIEKESISAEIEMKARQVSFELMHRQFNL